MIFSLFRNDKETINPEYFRIEVSQELATDPLYFRFIENRVRNRFTHRHHKYGGTIKDTQKCFITEAKKMGFSVKPIY